MVTMALNYRYLYRLLIAILLFDIGTCMKESKSDYLARRSKLFEEDLSTMTGSEIKLTDAEQKVNTLLMNYKTIEFEEAMQHGNFLPSEHFFKSKSDIENNDVFKIIKKMPKGGVLHIHDISMVDPWWLVNVTYDAECYMCISANGDVKFHFYKSPPQKSPDCTWTQVNAARKQAKNLTEFNEMLYNSMSLLTPDPSKAYPTQAAVWKKFESALGAASGLIFYNQIFSRYFNEALSGLYGDNVQYVEVRCLLPQMYDLDGKTYTKEDALKAYIATEQDFVKNHPDFSGAKFIYIAVRRFDKTVVLSDLKEAMTFRKKYSGYLAGFDLVGQEDSGHTLLHYLDELLFPSQQEEPMPYFFHAGETDWQGECVDENLIDALLLNTSRIGHGFAITKHPGAMAMAKAKNVAIEVNPISNQVLDLVSDMRNHPASVLLSRGYPVVISSDDPAVWGVTGVSYDYYEAFMGLGGREADLRFLKKLFTDSILYSAMTDTEKKAALKLWQSKWDKFISSILEDHYSTD